MARYTSARTEGRRLLEAYLADHSQAEIAAKLGIGQQSVSAWSSGRSRPSTHLRQALESLSGIPAESWMTQRERTLAHRVFPNKGAA